MGIFDRNVRDLALPFSVNHIPPIHNIFALASWGLFSSKRLGQALKSIDLLAQALGVEQA